MKDYIATAITGNGQIRIFAATTREMVEYARKCHDMSPVATAALGRLMTATVMMGSMMKGDEDLITLRVRGDGPIGSILATADSHGKVKGYVGNPMVELPLNSAGKLDVGGAVGRGFLTVIRDIGLKDPYVGEVELKTGEIGDDLTYYFASSEQVPSSVGLGVLVDKDLSVKQAGGFIVQLLPFAEDETIEQLEANLSKINSVTALLNANLSPEEIIEKVLEGMEPEFTGTMPVEFYCNCNRQRVEKALISLGAEELQSLVEDGKEEELKCQFCNKSYRFSPRDLEKLLKFVTN